MHYVLFYDYVADMEEKRAPYRDAHLAAAKAAAARGDAFLIGAFANPLDGGMLIFQGESPAVAEDFARNDPYVQNGLVTKWWVREWVTVIGKDAARPIA